MRPLTGAASPASADRNRQHGDLRHHAAGDHRVAQRNLGQQRLVHFQRQRDAYGRRQPLRRTNHLLRPRRRHATDLRWGIRRQRRRRPQLELLERGCGGQCRERQHPQHPHRRHAAGDHRVARREPRAATAGTPPASTWPLRPPTTSPACKPPTTSSTAARSRPTPALLPSAATPPQPELLERGRGGQRRERQHPRHRHRRHAARDHRVVRGNLGKQWLVHFQRQRDAYGRRQRVRRAKHLLRSRRRHAADLRRDIRRHRRRHPQLDLLERGRGGQR